MDFFLNESAEYLNCIIRSDRGLNLIDLKVEQFVYYMLGQKGFKLVFRVERFKQIIVIFHPSTMCELPELIFKKFHNLLDSDVRDNLFLYKYGELTMI